MTMTLEHALELGFRAGFIRACNWPAPVSQDVDSPAFVRELSQFIEKHTPILTQPAQSVGVAGAIRKGFMTAESCGPDNRYVLSIKFGSLDELQAAHNALVGLTAALQERSNG